MLNRERINAPCDSSLIIDSSSILHLIGLTNYNNALVLKCNCSPINSLREILFI